MKLGGQRLRCRTGKQRKTKKKRLQRKFDRSVPLLGRIFICMAADYVGPMPDIQIAYDEILNAIDTSGRKRTPESREIYKKWIGFESPDNVTELQVGVA